MNKYAFTSVAILLFLVTTMFQPYNKPVLAQQNYPEMHYSVYAPEYDPVRVRAAQMFAENAKKVGVIIDVKPVDFNIEVTKVIDDRDFDMYIIGWSSSNMPMYFSNFLVSWQDIPGGNNPEGFRNPEFDSLAKQLDSTINVSKQREIIFRMQEILGEQVPRLGIYTRYITQIWQKGWEGFHLEYWGYASPLTWRNAHHPSKNTFIVVINDDMRTVNPLREESIYEDYIWNSVYDTLVMLNDDYVPIPWLAYNWTVSEDGKTWTFHLVNNATFHDGEPLTASDVAFTLNYLKDNKVPTFISTWRYIQDVKVIDDYTVQVTLNQTYAWFLYYLADLPILPEHIWSGLTWNASEPPLIGSGPFMWSKRVTGEYVELTKFDNYWRSDMPKVDKLIFRVIKSMETAALALQNGEVDFYTYYVPPATLDTLKANPNLQVNLVRGFTYYYLGFNLRRPGLNRTLVRRALCYLMPKEDVVKGPLMGLGEPANWYISPRFTLYYDPEIPLKYPWVRGGSAYDEANRLLDEANTMDIDGDGIREILPIVQTPTTPAPQINVSEISQAIGALHNAITDLSNRLNTLSNTVSGMPGKLSESVANALSGINTYLMVLTVLVIINLLISIAAIILVRRYLS